MNFEQRFFLLLEQLAQDSWVRRRLRVIWNYMAGLSLRGRMLLNDRAWMQR